VIDVHLYTDYWASVLGMPGIVSEEVQQRGLADLDVFRSCLNRPTTRLPGFAYYLLMLLAGPVMVPYRMIQRVASRLHVPLAGEETAAELLGPYRLQLAHEPEGTVRVGWRGERLADGLVDPMQPEVVFSVVYPAYKILIAALLAIGVAFFSRFLAQRPGLEAWLGKLLLFGNFPLLAVLLYAIFRDWWTALLAPLPVFIVVWVTALLSPPGLHWNSLPGILAGLAVGYFVVDSFLVPRGMAPTLYLYVNDAKSPLFPYVPGQEPYWLQGRTYWVWRFVTQTRAEVHKFWESDWERVEVWVRAEGDGAGMIEWIVDDFHFRELWNPYERLVAPAVPAQHRRGLEEARRTPGRGAAWVVEVDTDFVGHWPLVRGVFLLPLRQGWRKARWRQLAESLRVDTESDRPRDYREIVHRLRLDRRDFLQDIPEYLRGLALRRLLALPWRYWRFPRGANTQVRPLLYGAQDQPAVTPASEPELQLKAPGALARSRGAAEFPVPATLRGR